MIATVTDEVEKTYSSALQNAKGNREETVSVVSIGRIVRKIARRDGDLLL